MRLSDHQLTILYSGNTFTPSSVKQNLKIFIWLKPILQLLQNVRQK
jgi:hypothetical protein